MLSRVNALALALGVLVEGALIDWGLLAPLWLVLALMGGGP